MTDGVYRRNGKRMRPRRCAFASCILPAPYTPPMRRNLSDMVVVITGASAGIGKALAKSLAGRGARLALAARRSDRLEVLNAQLGGSHLCVTTDVSDRAQCEHLICRTVEHFGRVDTLVCNAG